MYAAPFRPARRTSSSRASLFIVSISFSFRSFCMSTTTLYVLESGARRVSRPPTLLEHCWNTRSVPGREIQPSCRLRPGDGNQEERSAGGRAMDLEYAHEIGRAHV